MKGFVAIDGGGSKTEIVVVDTTGHVYFRSIIFESNPNNIGTKKSTKMLIKALEKVFSRIDKYDLDIEGIVLGLAGVEFGNVADEIKQSLQEKFTDKKIVVTGDLASVIELHLDNKDRGCVIISGTGFNMAFKNEGIISTVGGWGYLPDDYISGFDLGKDALIYYSKAIDGVGENTCLINMLEKHYGNPLWQVMHEIYSRGIREVASLARYVLEGYVNNDNVCNKIIDERVNNLVRAIKSKNDVMDIYLCGGIFEYNGFIVDKLKTLLGETYTLEVSTSKTIYGTVKLAMRELFSPVDDEFMKKFDMKYKELAR